MQVLHSWHILPVNQLFEVKIMPIRRIKGKILKSNVMSRHPLLRLHLPETYKYEPNILFSMMKRYSSVFIKPDKGSQGKGIIRVKQLGNNMYQISWGLQHRRAQEDDVLPAIKKLLRPKGSYLVQRGLQLAKYRDRYVDIRVYMQKPNTSWKISGKVVRVAAPSRFVTNYHQGGKPEILEKVLRAIYKDDPSKIQPTIKFIYSLSTTVAKVLDEAFPGIRQLGIDLGIDKERRIWIIEANTNPAFLTFKHLKDKTMYRRILSRRRYIRARYK
jgi:glutathione synthase/RimK-type ligase-like ATP-grasp enzyme